MNSRAVRRTVVNEASLWNLEACSEIITNRKPLPKLYKQGVGKIFDMWLAHVTINDKHVWEWLLYLTLSVTVKYIWTELRRVTRREHRINRLLPVTKLQILNLLQWRRSKDAFAQMSNLFLTDYFFHSISISVTVYFHFDLYRNSILFGRTEVVIPFDIRYSLIQFQIWKGIRIGHLLLPFRSRECL